MNENNLGESTSKLSTDQPAADKTGVIGGKGTNSGEHQPNDPKNATFARLYKADNVAERFVGRTEELNKLNRWFSMALAGHGKPVFIIGDPGIGKTELVRQFFTRLRDTEKISLTGRYFDVASGAPYKAFLDGLYDLTRFLVGAVERGNTPFTEHELRMLQACLKEIQNISSTIPVQSTDSDRIKYRTFDLLAQSYRLLTPIQPVILFLDDLQWADELSLEFLAYLIRAMQGERFFVACTVREHDIALEDNALRIWMRRMNRYNAYEQIKMQPLTESDIESLINLTFPVNNFTENFISLLQKETGGNPYYLLEIIKQIVEEGKLFWTGERWECNRIDDIKLPKSLVDLTELHLSRLDQDSISVFQQAAVIGEEFSFTMLQWVTELSERELLMAIERGIREFLIREEPRSFSNDSERYTFYYNTTRKVLYENLSTRQRRLLHLRAAEILDKATEKGGRERNAGELAYHYYQAGEMSRAFYWTVEAGTIACQRFNFDRARMYFEWAAKALEQLEETKNPPTGQLLAKYYYIYGQLHSAMGEYEQAVEFLRKAEAACRSLGERQKEAEVVLLIGNAYKQANSFSAALESYHQAWRSAQDLNAQHLQWPAAQGAARCEIELGHPQSAIEWLKQSIMVIDAILPRVSENDREHIGNARTEMETQLTELSAKMASAMTERHSGSFPALESPSSPPAAAPDEERTRVVEVMHSPMDLFKQFALWFKQLHNTSELLNKLSKIQIEPPRVVGSIFTSLKQLKARINDLDPISVNAQLSLIEKQLQEYQRWLQQLNVMLPPFTVRQYLERGMLTQDEMLQLARFVLMVQEDSEDDKGKIELLLTRALELEVDRHHIIMGLFPPDMVFTPLLSSNKHLQLLELVVAELEGIMTYSDMMNSNLTVRIRQQKNELGQLFWHPQILTTIIEIDLKLDLRFKELLEQEQRETLQICNQLLQNGVRMIPRRGQAGALDVEAARRMVERAKELLNTNYEHNRSGLMMLAEVGRFLRIYLQENNMMAAPTLDNPFVDVDVPPQPVIRALPPANLSSPTGNLAPSTNQGNQPIHPIQPVYPPIQNSNPYQPMPPKSEPPLVNQPTSAPSSYTQPTYPPTAPPTMPPNNYPPPHSYNAQMGAGQSTYTPPNSGTASINLPANALGNPLPTGQEPLPRQMYLSGTHSIPKPFVNESNSPEVGSAESNRGHLAVNEQIETKLQSRLAEICILLATKLRDMPVKVLQLKRSQLAIASWEVDALLSSEDDPVAPAVNRQNYLIRRSIALLAEMQEVGISCRELLSNGQRAEALAALATAEYFLEQAKLVAGELETQSHKERDAGQYPKAQNLAATRQKLMSTHQLLSTLIGWLKREMDK